MARTLATLTAQVQAWLNRRDIGALIPDWIAMCETDINETLRARCMVVRARQDIDGVFIGLPDDFITIESIRDHATGKPLDLEDEWTGPPINRPGRVTAYRLVADCIEFLPHPVIPSPIPLDWTPQQIDFNWYQKPKPLVNPQDTNPVLDQLYSVYLFGVCKYGALFELDDARVQQADGSFQTAVAAANLWKQISDYSGAPLRAVVRGF